MTYTPTEEANLRLVQRLVEAENSGDLDTYAACLAPNVEVWINGQLVRNSREGQRQATEATLAAFPDWRRETLSLLADGNLVALRWRGDGTHRAIWAGVPASGQRIEFQGTSWVEVTDGLASHVWIDMDMAGPLRQMTAQ